MWEDPIVAETRVLREEMMSEVGNDLDALYEYLIAEQEKYKDRVVRLKPRRAVPLGVSADAPIKTGG
jgi:hypothetical protein